MAEVNLPTGSYSYDELSEKYRNFMAPAIKVSLSGTDAATAGIAITSARVSTSTSVDTDTATVTIANAYDEIKRDFNWTDKFKLGEALEVELGYLDQLTTVFSGYITAVNYQFRRGGTPEVVLTGMDSSFKLMRGQQFKSWQQKKISDAVKEIAASYGLTTEVDDTGTVVPTLSKGYMTDFQYLQNVALMLNYECFIVGKKLIFRKRFKIKSPVITLSYQKNLNEFNLETNLSEQVSKVEVHGWDIKEQKEIKGSSAEIDKSNNFSKTGVNLLASMGTEHVEHIYANPASMQEANDIAKAILNGRALKLVTGEGEVVGLPEIRAGVFIKVDGLGSHLDEAYYVPRATHMIDSSGYVTQFQIQGNVVK